MFTDSLGREVEIPAEITERVTQLRKRLAEVGVTLSRRTLCELRAYCAAVQEMMTASPMEILDRAIAQRAMPMILAEANVEALHALPEIMPDMPQSLTLMTEPLPLPPL